MKLLMRLKIISLVILIELITNRGKEEKYAAQKAALELAKDIKAGEDMGDAVEDAVGQLDAAESELADSLQMSKEDPTTFIEIKIRDAERVEDVGNIVSKYANEDGLDISGDTVQFSVDPDTPLAKAVTAHGIDKIEAALKRDVDKISDSVVIVMAPDEDQRMMMHIKTELPVDISYDIMRRKAREERRKAREEDYEEDMYGMEGDDSYAANENEVQDEEYKGIKHKFSKEYRDKVDDEFKDHIKMRRRTPQGTSGVKLPPGPADDPDKYKDEIDKYLKQGYEIYNGDEEDNDLDHFLTKEQPEDYIPSTDYEDVLDDLVNKDKKEACYEKIKW